MFSRTSQNGAQPQDLRSDGAAVKAVPSIISSDLTIEGNLNSSGEIQVDGVVRTASFVVDVVHRADGDGSGESDGHEAGS